TDWTLFFRNLSRVSPEAPGLEALGDIFYQPLGEGMQAAWSSWLERHAKKVREEGRGPDDRRRAMLAINPWFIPRNHLVFQEIARATAGDFAGVELVLDAARRPFDEAAFD
ncbi:MAG TPA: hypothetical protein PK095_11595, partial [Myxococcota bacterium]|nr:hypothetical protein [Myxococcota bacterium]